MHRHYSSALRVSFLALLVASVLYPTAVAYYASPESPRSLPAIHSQSDFDSLAVVYDPNTPYALPHALFVIDRQNKNRVYYVNTKLYKFHKDFVNGTYLSLERGEDFFQNNYLKPIAASFWERSLSRRRCENGPSSSGKVI